MFVEDGDRRTPRNKMVRLGIDVACHAAHQASLSDQAGEFAWTGRRFRTTPADLQPLWHAIPDDASVTVVLEPTRNAWVPLAAGTWRDGGALAPEQCADLRIAACWRNGERYALRDVESTEITEKQGRAICAQRYAIPAHVRTGRRKRRLAREHKQRTDRREKKSTATAAPALNPSTHNTTEKEAQRA